MPAALMLSLIADQILKHDAVAHMRGRGPPGSQTASQTTVLLEIDGNMIQGVTPKMTQECFLRLISTTGRTAAPGTGCSTEADLQLALQSS